MMPWLNFYMLVTIIVSITIGSIDCLSKQDEERIEKATKNLVKQSCCPKDFQVLVLTKWEECQKITQWNFPDGDPNDLCRKDLFNKDGPCNPERQAKCNARKDEWIKCIDTITQKENVKLKEEFEDDDEAIRELPGDKLACYENALKNVKCD